VRPLRIAAFDIASATGRARTHDSLGEPRLSADTLHANMRPLHVQIDLIEMYVRRGCGVPKEGGPINPAARPDLVAVEGTFSRPGGSDYPLHAQRALPLQWLYRQQIPYVEVAPATLKVYATGSGATSGENKVTKTQVMAEVFATYGGLLNIPQDDNACDALVMLAMVLDQYGQPLAEVPQIRRRALAAVDWPELAVTS
jgi:crossover junction endodeoxyribonuclease RuvC